jgi:ComF family protein
MGRAMFAQFGTVLEACADVLFPPLCHACGALLPEGSRHVCPACLAGIPALEINNPIRILAFERLCGDGMLDDVVSLFLFEKGGVLQALLHQLKYAGATGLGPWFGRQIGKIVLDQGGCFNYDAIVPLPLHVAKRRERGYNQSERIAKGIACTLDLPVEEKIVKRVRHTQTQTALGLDARKINMEGAFEVPPKYRASVRGKSFLLIDDVITTGSTMRSCAGALREAGARRIVACSVAVAVRALSENVSAIPELHEGIP